MKPALCVLAGGLSLTVVGQRAPLEFNNAITMRGYPPAIRSLGVCDISTTSVACWDMKGRPSERLTKRVRTSLVSSKTPATYTYGRKSRCAILRLSSEPIDFDNRNRVQGFMMPFNAWEVSKKDRIYLVQTAVQQGSSSFAIDATKTQILGRTATLPLKKGATARVFKPRDVKFLAVFSPVPPPREARPFGPEPSYGDPRVWNLVLDLPPLPADSMLRVFAYDKQGKELNYVDRFGRPLPNQPEPSDELIQSNVVRLAMISRDPSTPSAPAGEFQMTVDPAYVGSVKLYVSKHQAVRLGGFPSDPKK